MHGLLGKLRSHLYIGLIIALIGVLLLVAAPWRGAPPAPGVDSDDEALIGRVVEVLEEGMIEVAEGISQPYQRLLLRLENGPEAGLEVAVEDGAVNATGQDRSFRPGDRVYVDRITGADGDIYYITDLARTQPILLLAALFVLLILLIGRGKGVRALGGTVGSLIVVFGYVVPQILAGHDPLLVSIIGALALLAVFNYLTYGWNPKAHAAMAGMALALLITGLLAVVFVHLTRLTGLGSEEGTFLIISLGPEVQLQRLLLGGIIIGSLGVLDDICVGQASAVFELMEANPSLTWRDLFRHGLNIGRDHIAATVNTLLLAYMGAGLPMMLLFSIYQEPLSRRISREAITEEIVRTLVGSMGLILAVPITSLFASLMAGEMARRKTQPRKARRLAG